MRHEDIVFSGAFVHLKKPRSISNADFWFVILSFLSFQDIRHITLTCKKFLSLRNEAVDHIVGQTIILRLNQEWRPVFHPAISKFFEMKDLSECQNQEHYFQEVELLRHSLTSCKTHFSHNGETLTVKTNDKKIKFCTKTGNLLSMKDYKDKELFNPEYEFTGVIKQNENSTIAFSDDNHFAIVKNDGSGKYYSFDPTTNRITKIREWAQSLIDPLDTEFTDKKPIVYFRNKKQLIIRIDDFLIIRQLDQNIIIHQSRFPTEKTCAITSYGNHLFFITLRNERVGVQRLPVLTDMLTPPETRSRKRPRE